MARDTCRDKSSKRKKDSQLLIRVNSTERDDFVSLCDTLDTSAAREIRRFMREFVRQYQASSDKDGNSA